MQALRVAGADADPDILRADHGAVERTRGKPICHGRPAGACPLDESRQDHALRSIQIEESRAKGRRVTPRGSSRFRSHAALVAYPHTIAGKAKKCRWARRRWKQ